MKNLQKGERGFSLIELIVVLVIIGVAMGITAPFLFYTLERVQIRSAVKEIAVALRSSRSVAISKKEERRFYLDLDEQIYWTTTRKEEGALKKSKSEKPLEEEEEESEESETSKSSSKKPASINKRPIDPLVKVDYFVKNEDEIDSGIVRVAFSPFGNSTGGRFHVVPAESTKQSLYFQIDADPVTGRVKVKEFQEEP